MPYTPVELRHVRVSRSLLGYNRAMVERMIEEVADSFETTWRERGELADHVEALDNEIIRLRRREELLTHTLVAAEQTASEVRDQARHTAERIVAEAELEARAIIRTAVAQRETLVLEARRIEAMLRTALVMLEPAADLAGPESPAAGTPESEPSLAGPEQVGGVEQFGFDPEAAAPDPGDAPTKREPRLVDSELFEWPRPDVDERDALVLPQATGAADSDEAVEPKPFLRRIVGEGTRKFEWGR